MSDYTTACHESGHAIVIGAIRIPNGGVKKFIRGLDLFDDSGIDGLGITVARHGNSYGSVFSHVHEFSEWVDLPPGHPGVPVITNLAISLAGGIAEYRV
jgi:hypothetical protein